MIKSLKEGIEKMNSKSSPAKNYNQELNIKNSLLEQQNSFLKQEIISKQNIINKLLDIQSDQLKTNLIPQEKDDNVIDVNNDSINGTAQGFSSSNEIMSYSGSNSRIGTTTDERNKESTTKKLQNNIEIKDNTNKNHTVDNNKVKEKKNKKIIIIGDSMLRYQRPKFLSRNNNFVNARFHQGTTTEDIVDFITPVSRKKPDAVIIHAGTNDLTNGTNTMKQVRKITKTIQEMEDSGKIGIGFSGIIQRADRNFKDQIKETNDKLKRYCEGNGFVYVDNDNINEKSLNKSLLHLNKAGNKLLSKNLLDCLKNLLFLNTHMHTLDAITDLSTNLDITSNSLKQKDFI